MGRKKLTYKFIKEQVEKEGYKLLSKEYINANSKLKLCCSKGHKFEMMWKHFKEGRRCKNCSIKYKKLTYNFIKDQTEKRGYKLLSKTYINTKLKLDIQCPEGHIYKTSWATFNKGTICPVCNNKLKKLTYKYVKSYIEKNKYELLSTKYISAHKKLKLKCNKGHIYKVEWASFQQGNRCSICYYKSKKLTYKFVKKEIENIKGYKLLSLNYNHCEEKLKIQCPNKHIFFMSWTSFYSNGNRCTKCNKITSEYIINYIKPINYKMLSEYKDIHTKLKFICSNNHEFKMSWNNFQSGKRCPVCAIENTRGKGHWNWKNYTEEDIEKFSNYRENVAQLSNHNYRKYYYYINPKKLKRSTYNYHLDHIYTISDGFKNNIPPIIISNKNNLQMLWYSKNEAKNYRSEITKQLLYHITIL